jgi:hypothetical protein
VGLVSETTWQDFDGSRHEDEVMAAYSGQPTIAEQSATHGAPLPPADDGPDPGSVTG